MLNFAECIAAKGKFCGRNAAASCAKNYGDSIMYSLNADFHFIQTQYNKTNLFTKCLFSFDTDPL